MFLKCFLWEKNYINGQLYLEMYLQSRSGCIQEMSDKRKLLLGGNRYFCPINVTILARAVAFSMIQETGTCSGTEMSSFVMDTASFTEENCFAISHNSAKPLSLCPKTWVLGTICSEELNWRKPLLSPSWTKILVPSEITPLIWTETKNKREKHLKWNAQEKVN